MLEKVSKDAVYFLEPSAGRGDIAQAIFDRGAYHHGHGDDAPKSKFQVDCIESSPELVSILAAKPFSVVGYDWLTYTGVCYYDACVMNPPFNNGDEHLLRAWDFMHNGEIVCLVNEETIKNPHSEQRKRLASLIEQHGNVELLGDCFSSAARKTDVRVAMVYLKKTSADDTIDMWASVTAENEASGDIGDDPAMLAIRDDLGNMQHYFDAANEHMLKAFTHLRKASLYMHANKINRGGNDDYKRIVALGCGNSNVARSEFIRKHRHDAWANVFQRMQFHRWLDKKQRDKFLADIERDTNAPFTKENIKATLQNVFLQRGKLFEQSVVNVFDSLTSYFDGNTSHAEGWKTNDSYKVNRKIVFPWGCSYDDGRGKYTSSFNLYSMQRVISVYDDLDRVVAVLAGEQFQQCECAGFSYEPAIKTWTVDGQVECSKCGGRSIVTIGNALHARFTERGYDHHAPNNKVESRYFRIKYWQKGTIHLEWKNEKLWEQFNIRASLGKRWIGTSNNRGDPTWEPGRRKAEPPATTPRAEDEAEKELRKIYTARGIPLEQQDLMIKALRSKPSTQVALFS